MDNPPGPWPSTASTEAGSLNVPSNGPVAAAASSSAYELMGLRRTGGSQAMNPDWSMTFDSNNNSSSCTSNESGPMAGSTKAKTQHSFGENAISAALNPRTDQQHSPIQIAELAKTIGNELRGSFIVLPQKSIFFDQVDLDADNVSTNSEDCVYAYRGDLADDQEPQALDEGEALDVDIDDDDETDFLEMDFDPEPNSEQENLHPGIENRCNGRAENSAEDDFTGNGSGDPVGQEEALKEWRDQNDPIGSNSPWKAAKMDHHDDDIKISPSSHCNDGPGPESLYREDIEVSHKTPSNGEAKDHPIDGAADQAIESVQQRVTGAKPKIRTQPVIASSSSPITEPTFVLHESVPSTSSAYGQASEEPSTTYQEQSSPESALCPGHCKPVKTDHSLPTSPTQFNIESHQPKQIQVYPNILNEDNIYSSLMVLGVQLHRERLQQRVESHKLQVTRTKTVADYLTEYTKASCDPRRFIQTIEDSCPPDVFAELEFNFQPTSSEVELLSVDGGEILGRWSSDQSLRELSRINNQGFRVANVLGKIANLLRINWKQKCREIDKVDSPVVSVPTFYKPGLLMISVRGIKHHTTLYKFE